VEALLCQGTYDNPVTGNDCSGGTGLQWVTVDLSVQRSGVTLESKATLEGGPTAALTGLEFIVGAQAGAVNIGADITVLPSPWNGKFTFGINF